MPVMKFDTLEALPEELREHAKTDDDGKVTINLVSNVKLSEFRDNNVKLSAERDTLVKKVTSFTTLIGEDSEAFTTELAELRETAQLVADGKLKGTDKIALEVETRITEMKAGYDKQLQESGKEIVAWKDKAGSAEGKLKRSIVGQAVTNAAIAADSGVDTAALPDILERAFKIFVVEDSGDIVPKNGEAVIYGGDGATPMTPVEWVAKLKETAPHFFKKSAGSGAEGTDTGIPKGIDQKVWDGLSGPAKLKLAREAQLKTGVRT